MGKTVCWSGRHPKAEQTIFNGVHSIGIKIKDQVASPGIHLPILQKPLGQYMGLIAFSGQHQQIIFVRAKAVPLLVVDIEDQHGVAIFTPLLRFGKQLQCCDLLCIPLFVTYLQATQNIVNQRLGRFLRFPDTAHDAHLLPRMTVIPIDTERHRRGAAQRLLQRQ